MLLWCWWHLEVGLGRPFWIGDWGRNDGGGGCGWIRRSLFYYCFGVYGFGEQENKMASLIFDVWRLWRCQHIVGVDLSGARLFGSGLHDYMYVSSGVLCFSSTVQTYERSISRLLLLIRRRVIMLVC